MTYERVYNVRYVWYGDGFALVFQRYPEIVH